MLTSASQNIQKVSGISDETCFLLDIPSFTQQIRIELISSGTNSFFIKDQENLERCHNFLKIWPKEHITLPETYQNWMKNNSDLLSIIPVSDPISCQIGESEKISQSKFSTVVTELKISEYGSVKVSLQDQNSNQKPLGIDNLEEASQKSIFANETEMPFRNGKYCGPTKNGIPEGQGVYKSKSGTTYTGYWVGGKFIGEGVISDGEGQKWKGVFDGKTFNGLGEWSNVRGNSYIGYFLNGLFDGTGYYNGGKDIWANGNFKKGKLHGFGQEVNLVDGWHYKGQFVNGKKNGMGNKTIMYGNPLKGPFLDGKFIGD